MAPTVVGRRVYDKVAIVTGSSSGLGRAIAFQLAQEGARTVICADLRPDAREVIAEEKTEFTHSGICRLHGDGKAIFQKTDVRSAGDMETCVSTAVAVAGRLDIIVNNAGSSPLLGKVHETDPQNFRDAMESNCLGFFHGCKYACAQFLRQEPDSNGSRGKIVNMSSIAGLVGLPISPSYCASKGAVTLLTKQVALDYAHDGVQCNAVCPGYVKTAMTLPLFETPWILQRMESLTPMWNVGSTPGTESVARAVVFLVSEDCTWITGTTLPIDGGLTAM